MASTDIIEFHKTWTQNDAAAVRKQVKYLEALMETSKEPPSPVAAMFQKGKNARNPVIRFFEERWYDRKITGLLSSSSITFSGYLQGEAISAASMQNHIKKNILLERESDGLQVRCSADPDYDAKTVTVTAHGYGATLSNSTAAETWVIIGHASSDYDDTHAPRGLNRKDRFVSTQLVKDSLEIPWTREMMQMELVTSEMAHNIKASIDNLKKSRDMSLLRAAATYSGGAFKTALDSEISTVTGLLNWPVIVQSEYANTNIYVNRSESGTAQPLNIDVLNDLAYYLEFDERADYNKGNWIIAMHSIQNQYLADEFLDHRDMSFKESEIGYMVDSFKSKKGKRFKVIIDDFMPYGTVAMFDVKDVKWGYYGDQNMTIEELGKTMENVIKKKVTFQFYGTVVRRPRQIGIVYGLPTSYST